MHRGFPVRREPLPELFRGFDGAPFVSCVVTGVDLRDPPREHLVYRVLRGGEAIVEYAITMDAYEEIDEGFSVASRERAIRDVWEPAGLLERSERLFPEALDGWLATCAVTGDAIDHDDEVIVVAHARGGDLLYDGFFPLALGPAAMERIQATLSPETRDRMDDFTREYLSPDPIGSPNLVLV